MPVVNLHRHTRQPEDIYVGRPGKGEPGYFGNPIRRGDVCRICRTVHTGRGSTLGCFEVWARQRLQVGGGKRGRVKALHGQTLLCFCVPKPCHGQILAALAEELNPQPEDLDDDYILELFS